MESFLAIFMEKDNITPPNNSKNNNKNKNKIKKKVFFSNNINSNNINFDNLNKFCELLYSAK